MKILWILRLLLFYVGVIPATILISTFGWLCAPFPALWRYYIITSWSRFFIWWAKITCGLQYKVIGRENIPAQPCVILCNHQSTWETIFMQVLLPPQTWVLKRELLFIPFFGWGLALIKPIAIDRKSRSAVTDTLEKGQQRLQEGRYVVFYPEGTRVPVGGEHKYSRTGAALAIAAHVPVLPIAHNAGNFWPRGPWIKMPGTITVAIGKAISDSDASGITAQAQQWINATKNNMEPQG